MAEPEPPSRVRRAWGMGLRPDPDILVSQWADKHRQLSSASSAEPGPWRTARTPYLREPMDCLSANSPVEEVVLIFAAQLGKSEVLLNALGYIIDHAPGPTMLIQPTVELGRRFSKQRVDPLLTSPRLAGKIGASIVLAPGPDGSALRARDRRASMQLKEFMGGVLVITGANSAVGLRSMPVRNLLADEIDGYPADVDDEGAPLELAEVRQRTFARRKTIKASTPTIAGSSAIERAFEQTDQRLYFVPCPHCGDMQVLEFARLTWSKLGLAPAAAVYVCRACERPILNHQKTGMLERGEWRPQNADADPKRRGYHLNALYSPVGWLSWGAIAEKFVAVRKKPLELRVFTNTVLAETWIERGEAPEWERLYHRREQYAFGTVPRGGLFLTAGADVQKDRIVVEIVAWGRGKTSWSIDYGVLPGDTADLENGPWKDLDAMLARTFPHEDGAEMPIRMLAVDSGFNTQTVYSWCRRYPLNRVIAVKGQPSGGVLIGTPSAVDIKLSGRRPLFGAYKVWPVVGGVAKAELYGFLKLEQPTDDAAPLPPGWCHFPEYDDDYFLQLTAEQLVQIRNRAGFVRLEWQLIPGRENHVLDGRVYARAAAALVGLDRFKEPDWELLERQVAPGGPPEPPPAPPRRSSWLRRRG